MENKKFSPTQIIIIIGLIGLAFYLGFSGVGDSKKELVEDQSVEQPKENLVGMEAARKVASEMGINIDEFNSCVEDPAIAQKVKDQQDLGEKAGVTGTPGSFVYDTVTKKAIELGGAAPLDTIKSKLADLKAGKGVDIDIAPINEEDFVKGNSEARYVVMEWSDYECPYCGRFQESVNQLVEQDTDVKWVYRQFPLDGLHPNTRQKSIAALCVGKIAGNDAFWQFSDTLLLQ